MQQDAGKRIEAQVDKLNVSCATYSGPVLFREDAYYSPNPKCDHARSRFPCFIFLGAPIGAISVDTEYAASLH